MGNLYDIVYEIKRIFMRNQKVFQGIYIEWIWPYLSVTFYSMYSSQGDDEKTKIKWVCRRR